MPFFVLMRHYVSSVWMAAMFTALSTLTASAQNLTTKGTEFRLAFLENSPTNNNPQISVVIGAENDATGVVEMPLAGVSTPFSVTGGTTVQVVLPTTTAESSGTETIANKGVVVRASDSVNVVGFNYRSASADASLILPIHALRSDYMVMSYNGRIGTDYSSFLVLGVEDGTTVRITPSATTEGGRPAGVPFDITLNAHESYQVRSLEDLTGTRVQSVGATCQPLAVFGGNRWTRVGGCGSAQDHLYEQIFPLNTLGKSYLSVPLLTRIGDSFRVLATEDNTTISVNGTAVGVLNQAQYRDTVLNDAAYFTADKPIMVGHLSRSQSCDGSQFGDPFMALLSPSEQPVSTRGTVNAFDVSTIVSHYLNVLVRSGATSLFSVDGVPVSSTLFTPVPGNPDFSYYRTQLPGPGNYALRCDSGFISMVYGFGNVESYGYFGDAVLNNIALRIETADNLCTNDPVGLTAVSTQSVQTWEWTFGDGSAPLTGTGDLVPVEHTFTEPGSYTVRLFVQREGVCGEDSTLRVLTLNEPPHFETCVHTSEGTGAPTSYVLKAMGGGGQAPYEYSLDGVLFQPWGRFEGLSGGTVTVILRDANGCRQTLDVTLP